MGTPERVISIDIGTSSVRMAEFEYTSGNMVLQSFDWRSIESTKTGLERVKVLSVVIKEMIVDNNFTSKRSFICTTGQNAFVRFVKLPPISGDEAKIKQVVKFEAEDKVPFSLDEVSWDYQLIPSGEDGDEIEVMIVVMKNDVTSSLTGGVSRAGLKTERIIVSSAALLNAAKANSIGNDECVMLLDIGDKCSDLIFIDGDKFFSRSIPIAGHTITQQIVKEFKVSIGEAEDIKRKHGFVALGAGYEEPKSEVAAVVSKIIRNVMTRLHNDINQTRSIFKNQYKGNPPVKLYLTGGSSLMRYTDVFFTEKLQVETLYFNAFEAIHLAPRIQPEKLQPIAHTFATVIGTALHLRDGECPIEINLIPEFLKQQFSLAPKKKFLFAAMAVLMVSFLAVSLSLSKQKNMLLDHSEANASILTELVEVDEELEDLYNDTNVLLERLKIVSSLSKGRNSWGQVMSYIAPAVPKQITITSVSPLFKSREVESTSKYNKSATVTKDTIYTAKQIEAIVISGTYITESKSAKHKIGDFLNRLQQAAAFSDKFEDTRILGTERSSDYPNMRKFEIEVGLTKPIILSEVK